MWKNPRRRSDVESRADPVIFMLDRLEAKSWIVFEVTVFSAGRRVRTRRVVRLTTENLTALRKSHGAMLTLWNGFERALDP